MGRTVKHFVFNTSKSPLSRQDISDSETRKENVLKAGDENRFSANENILLERDDIKGFPGRVIIKINDKSKDFHTFQSGLKIRRERRFNNFNVRETNPVNAIVIDSTYIPSGSEILINPNAIHESYRIYDYKNDTSDISYYSIREEECFAYFDNEWQPLKNFEFGLRVYRPHEGIISNIQPTKLKDVLFVTTGSLKGNVVVTLSSCDYEIVFMDKTGREGNIIRFRHSENRDFEREEVVAINNRLTEDVMRGNLYVGISANDCCPLDIGKFKKKQG